MNKEFEREMKPEVVLTIRDFEKDPTLPVYNWELMSVGNLYDGLEKGTKKLTIALNSFEYWAKLVREGTVRGRAVRLLLKVAQSQMFEYELEKLQTGNRFLPKNLQSLNLFLDKYGILRANTRLINIEAVPDQMKCPIMLKANHRYTLLVFAQMHIAFQHPVSENLFRAKVAEMYKVIGDRNLFKQLRDNCILCQRMHGNPMRQQMAPLPSWRFEKPFRAFSKVGMDFAGPFEIRDGPGGKPVNRYVLLFTCLQVRALHLEVCENMKTVSVLNALSRLCDVRGVPDTIFCDNQSSFHAAERELQMWFEELDWNKISSFEVSKFHPQIQWRYNTPRAPHMGGVYEIMVKAMKRAFRILAKNKILSDESFRTVMSRAAALVNSRPLSHYIKEDGDCEILTPNTFLVGHVGCSLTVGHEDEKVEPLRVWRQVNAHVKELWQRFLSEILPELQPRDRWTKICGTLEKGDMVLIVEKNIGRGLWRMGIVTEIEHSEDGLVRHVLVKQGGSTPRRHALVNLIKLFTPSQAIMDPAGNNGHEAEAVEKIQLDDIEETTPKNPRTPIPQFEELKRRRQTLAELQANSRPDEEKAAEARANPNPEEHIPPIKIGQRLKEFENQTIPPIKIGQKLKEYESRTVPPIKIGQRLKEFELQTALRYQERNERKRAAQEQEQEAQNSLDIIKIYLDMRKMGIPVKETISFQEGLKTTKAVLAEADAIKVLEQSVGTSGSQALFKLYFDLKRVGNNPYLPECKAKRDLTTLTKMVQDRIYRKKRNTTYLSTGLNVTPVNYIEEEVE